MQITLGQLACLEVTVKVSISVCEVWDSLFRRASPLALK